MSSFLCSLLLASRALLFHDVELQSQSDELNVQQNSSEFLWKHMCKHRGPTGPTGPTGLQGPVGPMGSQGLGTESVFFSMSLTVVPVFDFAFFASSTSSSANPFDPSTTNPSPVNFASTFLVPFDGTISNLTIRLDFKATENINPTFAFTVYSSSSIIGTSVPIASWASTALTQSTGSLVANAGSSLTATFQNLEDIVHVTAGTILTVVISPSGYNMFDIQPGTFSTSFKYTPNN